PGRRPGDVPARRGRAHPPAHRRGQELGALPGRLPTYRPGGAGGALAGAGAGRSDRFRLEAPAPRHPAAAARSALRGCCAGSVMSEAQRADAGRALPAEDANGLATRVVHGELSAESLLDASLARIAERDGDLGAVCWLAPDVGREAARAIDR